MSIPFLTAYWQDLVVANYEVDPNLLEPFLAAGTELDMFEGKHFVSLVAFGFNKNKLFGLIPSMPSSFEEINLRFYVKRTVDGEVRRGVTFIQEIVPSQLIAWVARILYNEPYIKYATQTQYELWHRTEGGKLTYKIQHGQNDFLISAKTNGNIQSLEEGKLAHFILEHYWGYTPQLDGKTCEYKVTHPSWKFWDTENFTIIGSEKFFPETFQALLQKKPHSVFIAEGSKISVFSAKKFKATHRDPLGWVLYDGKCGFCTWWIPFWKPTIQKAGYDSAPVQAKWVKEKLSYLEGDLNNDIRLLLKNGTLINGADAYIFGMKRVWWSSPIGFLLGLPGFRWLTWKFYKIFNRNRFFVSRICKLVPPDHLE